MSERWSARVARAAFWLVAPAGHGEERRHTRLFGALWLSATAWLLVGMGTGLFEGGWLPGLRALSGGAAVIGAVLLWIGDRRLPDHLYVGLTLLGSLAISLAVLWGGDAGGLAYGVVFVYVTCFCFVTLRGLAVPLVAAASVMHMAALVVADHPAPAGVWVTTWGPAVLTGALSGAVVAWLDDTLGQLRAVDDHRRRFIATVSHELRTPLTAILGFTEVLDHRWSDLDDDERRQFVDVIDRQAARQLRLVDDVLALTSSSSTVSPPLPQEVELAKVLPYIAEIVRIPVGVTVEGAPVAFVDPDHLEQIVTNLLVNSARYGAPPIELRASANGTEVHIEVCDRGPGLAGGLDGGLAEPFVQGDSGDRRESSGVGLGLTICRRLAAVNGGELRYEDVPDGGACLRLHLPKGRTVGSSHNPSRPVAQDRP